LNDALLLLPDFALIALGFGLCRYSALGRSVWEGVERLVYFVLFPALLFQSIARNPIDLASSGALVGCGLAVCCGGIALAYAARYLPRVESHHHASGAQTAFRFNSYVALAVAERLAGSQGVAWTAMLMALCVPLCNFAAVWPLARHGGHRFAAEIARNPLIIATVGGLAANLAGLALPAVVSITLQRLGTAALPLGLMAVGAGLRLGALREDPRLASAFLGIRHVAQPTLAIVLALALPLPVAQQAILVAFAAMPTASSAYVLAARMGGHASYVAGLVTASTLIASIGLPAALAALAWCRA